MEKMSTADMLKVINDQEKRIAELERKLDLATDLLEQRSCKHCKSNDPKRSATHLGFYCTNKSSDYYGGYPFRRGVCECFEKE